MDRVLFHLEPNLGWLLAIVDMWTLFRYTTKIALAGFIVVIVDRWLLFRGDH